MRAARLAGYKTFEFVDVEKPKAMQGQVLIIQTTRMSIYGSDLRTFDSVHAEESYPFGVGNPCHEWVGEVVESSTKYLSVGDRVIFLPTATGGLAEYSLEVPDRCIKLPEDGDLSVWTMAQPVGTVMYSLQRIGNVIGKRVAILGQGGIGISFAQLVASQGASQVIVSDILDYSLEMSKRVGATHTINSSREDLLGAITEITDGEMVDIAIEACGSPDTAHQVYQILRSQGTVGLFGLTHDQDIFPFDYSAMMSKLPTIVVTIAGRAGESPRYIGKCVDLMAQGRLDLSHLVTHRMKFDDVQAAYDTYSEKKDRSIKVVMEL